MFRLSYIDEKNQLAQKSFGDTRQIWEWIKKNPQITALKILVWDEFINCYSVLQEV